MRRRIGPRRGGCGAPAYQEMVFSVKYVYMCIISTFGQGKAECTVLVYISVLPCILF